MIGIDTNVLLRYLIQDEPSQTRLAKRFIHGLHAAAPAHVSLITLAELAWVLTSRYRASDAEIVATVETLLSDDRFEVQDSRTVWSALDAVQRLQVGLADALIAFGNLDRGCSHTVTFDKRALRMPGVQLLQ
jgi:predicted nucleic-acid-binding protein